MRHSFPTSRKKSTLLTVLAMWIFCWMAGGMAHLACHLEDDARMPQPAAPHPCLTCRSLAQSGRSDILTLTRKTLQPAVITYYISRPAEQRPATHTAALSLAPNRGPPSLLRI